MTDYSGTMRAILQGIARAGLSYGRDTQGRRVATTRPGGRIYADLAGDRYELQLWGEGTGAALQGIGGDLAQALGVAWARVDLVGEGRAFVVLPHQARKG